MRSGLIALIILAVVGYVYFQESKSSNSSGVKESVLKSEQWIDYKSGEELYGVIINYPDNWKVKYKEEKIESLDYMGKTRIMFDFAPKGWSSPESVNWMGWGQMNFDVYETEKDIDQWVGRFYPEYKDGLRVEKSRMIGEKPTFLVSSDGKKEWAEGWIPREVVLGSSYSYVVGYSQDGERDFIKILEKEIFSKINIK